MNSKNKLILAKRKERFKRLAFNDHPLKFDLEFRCHPSGEDVENGELLFDDEQNELEVNPSEFAFT